MKLKTASSVLLTLGALLVLPVACGGDDDDTCDCTCICEGEDPQKLKGIKDKNTCNTECEATCTGGWNAESTCPTS